MAPKCTKSSGRPANGSQMDGNYFAMTPRPDSVVPTLRKTAKRRTASFVAPNGRKLGPAPEPNMSQLSLTSVA